MLSNSANLALWLTAAGLAGNLHTALAVSIPFTKSSTANTPSFTISTTSKADSDDPFAFDNVNSIQGSDIYVATIKVAGQDFEVQLDTGSSDLWLDTSSASLSGLTNTNLKSGITYGDGTVAQGPIMIGNVTFGDFTISQAFISAPGSNATTNGDKGLLGVGPPLLSAIRDTLQTTTFNGDSVLENVFQANTSLSTFITFQLSRSQATGTTDGGIFTIGEIDSNFTAVSQSSKLPVISTDRWVVLMDGMFVNGQPVSGGSAFEVQGQGTGQTLANLDTGTSLAQIPQTYAQEIYGSIPGAQLLSSQGIYIVPCSTKLNISFVFGGVSYPVHPIDAISATTDDNGEVVCFSGFPMSDGASDSEDFLLGDSFLRNVYSLFAFGKETSTANGAPPSYIQLQSSTNLDQAFSEFDTLSAQRNASLLGKSSSGSGSGGSSGGGNSSGAASMSASVATSVLSLLGLGLGMLLM